MRHQKARKRMGSSSSHRRAILRNMVTSLFKYGQLETTDAKARQLKPVAEKMITLAKRGDLHARRKALSFMKEKTVTHRLFDEMKDRFMDRQGGYVRVVKKGFRKGDGAPVSIVQLLAVEEEKKKTRKKTKGPSSKTKAPATAPSQDVQTKAPDVEEQPAEEKPLEKKSAGEAGGEPDEEEKASSGTTGEPSQNNGEKEEDSPTEK